MQHNIIYIYICVWRTKEFQAIHSWDVCMLLLLSSFECFKNRKGSGLGKSTLVDGLKRICAIIIMEYIYTYLCAFRASARKNAIVKCGNVWHGFDITTQCQFILIGPPGTNCLSKSSLYRHTPSSHSAPLLLIKLWSHTYISLSKHISHTKRDAILHKFPHFNYNKVRLKM